MEAVSCTWLVAAGLVAACLVVGLVGAEKELVPALSAIGEGGAVLD